MKKQCGQSGFSNHIKQIEILPGEQLADKQYDYLAQLWERSVRLTHQFLSEQDIDYFRPLVRHRYLKSVPLFLAWDKDTIAGFIGVAGTNIEMLFIDPDYCRQGIGSQLLDYAIQYLGAECVDVNEQNQQATVFYLQRGFSIIGRSETDGAGKAFPLLHLSYSS